MEGSNKVDKKLTKQVRIDAGYHKLLKLKAVSQSRSVKSLLEEYLAELLEVGDK